MEYFTLIITVALGLPGLILYFRQKKTKLLFIQEKEIHFQEDLLENFENLTISYDGLPVSDKLTYVKGSIVCDGSKDIVEIENTLEIYNLSITWLNFKITNASEGLVVNSNIENNKAIVSFGYIKNKEFFEFEGIINRNEAINRELVLNFFHRIPNIPRVQQISKSKIETGKKALFSGIIYCMMSIFFLNYFSKIESYSVEVYNSLDKSIAVRGFFKYTPEYDKVLHKLNNDYWGYELFFIPSKNYTINYINRYSKDKSIKEKSLYFKRTDYYTLIMVTLVSLILFYGIFQLLSYVVIFNYKDYFKIQNKSAKRLKN